MQAITTPDTIDARATAAQRARDIFAALAGHGWTAGPADTMSKTYRLPKDPAKGGSVTHGKAHMDATVCARIERGAVCVAWGWENYLVTQHPMFGRNCDADTLAMRTDRAVFEALTAKTAHMR